MSNAKNDRAFDAARRQTSIATGSTVAGHGFGSLHDAVVEQIGLRIMKGEFLPGDTLPNAEDCSEMFGVSRTVLREAIKVLATKGLVESRPKTGTRVRPRSDWNFLDQDILCWRFAGRTDSEDVRSIFELRRAIMPMAASLAAQRATAELFGRLESAICGMEQERDDATFDLMFHETILAMTGNEFIGSLAALIETALVISFRLSRENPKSAQNAISLYRSVCEKIASADGQGTYRAMSALVDGAEEDVLLGIEIRMNRNLERRRQI